jgi:hypothetical protein
MNSIKFEVIFNWFQIIHCKKNRCYCSTGLYLAGPHQTGPAKLGYQPTAETGEGHDMASRVTATSQYGHRRWRAGSASGARKVGCDGELICGKKWVSHSPEKGEPR